MDDSIPRSILLFAMIVLGALFASCETAFSYCNRLRMKTLADDGDKVAARVISILDKFDHAIITILIGTNLAHVIASVVATVLAISLLPWSDELSSLIASVVLTLLIFVFSEMLPKAYARDNADRLSRFYSLPLKWLIFLLTPLDWFFSFFTWIARKIAGAFVHQKEEEPTMTEDEFSDMVDSVEETGDIAPTESRIIKSAIEFGDTSAGDVMVPLENVIMLSDDASPEEVRRVVLSSKYSRIPVYRGHKHNIIGVLRTRNVLWSMIHNQPFSLRDSLHPVYISEPQRLLVDLFEDMGRSKAMMAVIIDSFGQSSGIVTLEDILEEIVGEIYDEDDLDQGIPGEEAE